MDERSHAIAGSNRCNKSGGIMLIQRTILSSFFSSNSKSQLQNSHTLTMQPKGISINEQPAIRNTYPCQ
jgi:hypothetical protein